MKKTLLSVLGISAVCAAFAQSPALPPVKLQGHPKCAFNEALHEVGIEYSRLSEVYLQNARPAGATHKATAVVYDIPVVFHLVYGANQPTFNIPDSVFTNQIQILNKAFRKQHADTGATRAVFKSLSADAEIQFHLATKTPSGAASTGITRTVSSRVYFGSSSGDLDSLERVKSTAAGGIDPWPTTNYLNIWICNMTDDQGQLSVLGYGIPPLNPLPNNWPGGSGGALSGLTDGVVLQVHAIGSNNPIGAPVAAYYTKGRALVHEVGHYLGLQHEFGGGDGSTAVCGTSTQSDGIGDTPEQGTMSFTPGAAPSPTKNSCGSGPTDTLDMWEDYMDYTVDAYQTLFTHKQVALMRGVLANQRSGLTTPTTSIAGPSLLSSTAIYPNPASTTIYLSHAEKVSKVTFIDLLGRPLMQLAGAAAERKSYDISGLMPGNYILQIETEGGRRSTGRFSVVR